MRTTREQIDDLLDNLQTEAFEDGKKEGIEEGRRLANEEAGE